MLQRFTVRAIVVVALTTAVSLTCGEGAGPDPNAVALVVISPDTGSTDTGDSLQLTAVARNAEGTALSGKSFTWSTLDPTLVTVSGNGRVHGRWPGNARVVATSEDRADTARVRVTARIDSLALAPALDTLRSLSERRTLTVTAYIGGQVYDGGEYTWERSDTTFLFLMPGAPPSRTAEAFSRKNGSTIVRVREARGATDSARIVVRQRVVRVFAFDPPSRAYRACPLPANVVPLDANGAIVADVGLNWRSTDTTLARVDSMGLITPLAVGIDTISVRADTSSYRFTIDIRVAPVMPLFIGPLSGGDTATVGQQQYTIGEGKVGGLTVIDAPAQFRLLSSDTSVASSTPAEAPVSRTFPFFSEPLRITGRNRGLVTLTPYLCDVQGPPMTLIVTRPKLGIIGTLPILARTDQDSGFFYVYSQDSTGASRYPAEPVTVRVTESDTTVVRSNPEYRYLAADNLALIAYVSYLEPGFSRLVVEDSAGLYAPDSTDLIKVMYPPVLFTRVGDTLHLGMRQRAVPPWDPDYVHVDRVVSGAPLLVDLSSSDTGVARITPGSVAIPVGNTADTIDIFSIDQRGTATISAHANRHTDASVVVVVGRPAIKLVAPDVLYYPGQPGSVQLLPADSATGAERLPTETVTFSLVSSDTTVVALDSSTLTIPVGEYPAAVSGVRFKAPGTALITASDPRAAPYAYSGASAALTVTAPNLTADSALSLGIEQQFGFAIVANGPVDQGDVVRVTQRKPAVATLADTIATHFVNGLFVVQATGISAGVDTVIATLPGFLPDTGTIVVAPGLIEVAQWPSFGLQVGQSWPLELKVFSPNGDVRVTAVTKTFTLTANPNIEFLQDGVPITTVTLDAGQHFTQFTVRGKAAGTGTVTVSATNYPPVTKSVTVAP